MMPLSMETLFLILSGAILVAGILYWLWSHIQLTQKKVQILENAVFELRGMLTSGAATGPPQVVAAAAAIASSGSSSGSVTPAPTPAAKVYSDLEDDAAEDWDAEEEGEVRVIREVPQVSTPLEPAPGLVVEERTVAVEREEEIPDDLMPGGRIQIGEAAPAAATEEEESEGVKRFKELFVAPAAAARTPESLDSMPVKELRRLATQRGIQGADDMKKKEILAALRRQVVAPTTTVEAAAAPATEEGGSVAVEKTLDLTEAETVEAEILE